MSESSDEGPIGPNSSSRRPVAAATEQPFKSKFFGSGTSSSGSDPSGPRSFGKDPMIRDRRRSRSSGRSKESGMFESIGSGIGLDDLEAPGAHTGRPPRGPEQHRPTSFQAGFSGQMEYDANGNEHSRPGTKIHTHHTDYHRNQSLANEANDAYELRKTGFPRRERRDRVAIGDANQYGLAANYTSGEHRDLRRLAQEAFRHKRDETLGRESFNKTYGTVWEKRTLQTDRDSVENHRQAAHGARRNADHWLGKREAHRQAMVDLGIREDDLTSYSSWGSRDGSDLA